jgi:chemotaxis protein histidine kinase CheA
MNAPNKPSITVEIIKMANRLKARLGVRFQEQESGFIDPEVIAEADKLIAGLCVNAPETIEKHLQSLTKLWAEMKGLGQSPERAALSEKIFTIAHEIKDVGALCGFELIAHFAESLRDYIGETNLNLNAQVVIIQAHLDAMQTVHHRGFRKEAGPEAEELKRMVRMAIEKYR